MRQLRKLTKREWKEIGEKYKDGGVHMYRGKLTYFYNGEKLWDDDEEYLVYNEEERQKWKVIMVLPGVEIIPEYTFQYCENVNTVIMSDSVKRIEYDAFRGCYSLELVRLSKTLEYIGQSAFSFCSSLTSIFIPESCTEIGYMAFNGCKKLIIFNVTQHTKLGESVISRTALSEASPFQKEFNYTDDEWIKTQHDNLPLHNLCCSEDPKLNQNTIIPTKQECFTQDELGFTPFMYLIANNTSEYDTIEQMIKIGEMLFIKDKKGRNSLHHACDLGDEAMIRLLVRKGGRALVSTIKSGENDESSSMIKSALLLHDYIYAIENTNRSKNFDEMDGIDEMIDILLDSKPFFREITEIMSIEGIPDKHRQKFREYNEALLDQELKSFQETQEKVPLMRSTIIVVGRGRDGKTSTINSLKGLPFQPYCESTKGSQTSEVDVHEIGIHVTNVEATSNVAFEEAERDPFSTIRSMESHLMKSYGQRKNVDTKEMTTEMTPEKKTASADNLSGGNSPPFKRQKVEKTEQVLQIEEEDVAKKVDNIDLPTSKDGKSIRFTIYDNGGQRVFRSIQNLFLSREGIFIVVFDMMKIFNEDSRKEALEHLRYWLYSIKVDACGADSDEYTDPSIKYPPVILVGTHYDEFLKLKGDRTEGLKALNKIFVDNLPLSDLVPLACQSNDFVPNDWQDLCFWPVDNSNPNDANICAIRRILLEAAMNDPGFDIAQEVPISFLRAMDKLTAISEEVPILPIINRNDPQESSVMKIMIECGVFEDGINDEQRKLDICKAIVKQYQSIGHFIYFYQVGLEDYCILDPQWLINMITYIIRDFKLHRFRRDFNAMSLNNGESWKALLNEGILGGTLLRKLWLDREHEQFLTKLMLELGIFGQLFGDAEALSRAKFTVPIAMTISSNESRELSLPALREHLGVKSLDDTMKETIDMFSCPFNLVPFYSRLVNRLISEWRSGYNEEKTPPELLPCAANLYLGKDYKFSILINEEDSTLDIFVSDHKKMNIILKYILEACSFVDAKVYRSRLELGIPAVNLGDEIILRNANNATTITTEAEIQETEECHPNLQALIDVFEDKKLARKIYENAEDMTPEELIQMYYSYSDRDAFAKDILPELGIMKKWEQKLFISKLEKKAKPTDEIYAIFNFLDGNHLAVKDEEEAIHKNMRKSPFFYFAYTVLRDKTFEDLHKALVAHEECKVVHFGMHGSSIDTFVTTTLASRLQKSSVKCMVLNMCKSEYIAEDLRDKAKIEKLVYWLSDLEDNAARAFSEAFYYYLCLDKKANYLEFQAAFDYATERLLLRGFLFLDPANKEELEQKKRDRGKPDLVAAGIPKFYDSSQEQQEDLTRIPTSPFYASRNANSVTSTVATQPDIDHSMDVDRNNASEQEEKLSSSILQEEPPPSSSTSTAMASTQPYNQNSFRQSDIHSSLKKSDEQSQSDDAGLTTHDASSVQSVVDKRDFQILENAKACQLKCIYKFACGHEIEANCQFIKYNNTTRPSLTDIKDIQHRKTPARSKFICSICKKNFCKSSNGNGLKKIPIPIENTDGNEFHDCFFAHNCIGNHLKPIINVGQICRDFTLTSKDNKSGNSIYSYCNEDRCIEEDKARKEAKEAENLDSFLAGLENIIGRENDGTK